MRSEPGSSARLRPVGASSSEPSVFAELPARGLQALSSVTLAPRATLPIEPRLHHRGLAATVPTRGRGEVLPEEMPLAGYLLARALDGRKVEGKDFERLRRADESVREARALLAFGRGNIREDNEQSAGEAFSRIDGARELKLGSTKPSAAARGIWAGAGACIEHAHLSAFAHAAGLDAGSKEAVVLMAHIGHAWAESVIPQPWNLSSLWKPSEKAIVLDAWKDGPAVFSADSTRTPGQWRIAFPLRRITTPQPELLANAKKAAQGLASTLDPRALKSKQPPEWLLFNASPLISNDFMARVLHKPATKTRHPAIPAEVRKEILAVGVARELMVAPELPEGTPEGHGRIRSAAAQAPALIDALGNLTKITPRRYRPWTAPVPSVGAVFGDSDAQRLVRRQTDGRPAFLQPQEPRDLAAGAPSTEGDIR